jgi:hypothetical protein
VNGSESDFVPSEAALADAFLDLVAAVALAHPTLFLIDDAHVVDADSWRLLGRLARLRPSFALLTVIDWDSGAAELKSRENVEDWVVGNWVELRRLRPFTRDEVRSLVRLRGWRHEGAIEEAGRQVFDNSRGHPELVFGFLQVLDENRLRPSPLSDDPPEIPDLTRLPLSSTLKAYFERKLANLDSTALDVVRMLGNADYATIQTLEYSTGLDAHMLRPIIADLMDREIVEDVGTGVGLVNRAFADLVPSGATQEDVEPSAPTPRSEAVLRPPSPSVVPATPDGRPLDSFSQVEPPPLPPGAGSSRAEFWRTVRIRTTTLSVTAVVVYIVWSVFIR